MATFEELAMHRLTARRPKGVGKGGQVLTVIPLATKRPIRTRPHHVRIENPVRMSLIPVFAPSAILTNWRMGMVGITTILQSAKLLVLVHLAMLVICPATFLLSSLAPPKTCQGIAETSLSETQPPVPISSFLSGQTQFCSLDPDKTACAATAKHDLQALHSLDWGTCPDASSPSGGLQNGPSSIPVLDKVSHTTPSFGNLKKGVAGERSLQSLPKCKSGRSESFHLASTLCPRSRTPQSGMHQRMPATVP